MKRELLGKLDRWLLEKCWFRNLFFETPCNTSFCCCDWCKECDL